MNMDNIMNLDDLTIPSYIEDRINLDDPSEAAYIDDIAASMESDLTIISGIVAFESLEVTPFVLNNYDNVTFGLEANKFVEAAKQTYYKLKQRAKQFIKFAFGFFLNFLRGSSDVKAVIMKYSKKLKDYSKAFEKLRRTDETEKELSIRDVKYRLGTALATMLILTSGLDTLMNAMYSDKSSGPETRILRFATSINQINAALVNKEFPNKELDEELINAKGSIDNTESMKKVKELIGSIFKKVKVAKDAEGDEFRIHSDNNKTVKESLADAKEMYKEKIESTSMSYADSYDYMKNMLKVLTSLIDPKLNQWDFKKISQKVEKIDRDLVKEIDRLGSDKEDEMSENKSTANAIKIVMNAGSYLSTSKNIISTTLKTFKGDMEVFFTECSKVGSILSKKQ